ncbi:hypothetical protein ABZ504_03230 [Streptomyces mirabilis]|uniref:hypothetical protein n=1 Tax=Streptomyces mirabilis TaxID=68239 RepID=UPI0033DC65DC
MSDRMRFILDGDDRLSPVLNHAGDSSARLHHRLNDDMNRNGQAVRRFTQDADGRLRDLRGRFISVADASRLMGDGMPDLTRRLGDVSSASSDTAASMGKSGGGLGGALMGVAAVAGLSLLPALGALVPMMAGAALAAGTLKLGFAGVGDAMTAAGKGKKEYAAALKKLSPPAREFTKALVSLKKEFGGVGKEIQKAMLPGFTKAVKAAGPVVKILGKAMTDMGGAFGKAAEGVGRLLKDSGFQSDLQTNLKLGTGFIRDMTGALGPFIRSLLDFGAASGPTLKAFSDGISGLLTKGLPGLFQGLTPGIGGAAKMLDGLFSAINTILPALGRLSGQMGKTLGPLFGEAFRILGDVVGGAMDGLGGALKALDPIFKDLTFGLKTIRDLGAIIGPTMADAGLAILGGFAPIGGEVNKAVGPLQRLDMWVNNNKGSILEASRIFGDASINMVSVAVQMVPPIIKSWRLVSTGVLTAIGAIVHASASAWGWLPGLGPKLKSASREFDQFKGNFLSGLDTAGRVATDFAASTQKRLAAGKLKLDINNWQSQIETAKAKLKTVPPEKQAALKAKISDLQAKVADAKSRLASIKDKTASVKVNDQASGPIGYIQRLLAGVHSKTVTVTTYAESHVQKPFRAAGGPVPRFAGGGMPSGQLQGPGTGTSDSIPMWWASNGEYIVNARSTSKYRSLIEAINSGTLGTGRGMPGAGGAVAQGLASGMTGGIAGVGAAARTMAAAVTAGVKDELQIASPSKKAKALMADFGKGLILGLTGSSAKIKSVSADLAKDIRTAFSGRKESNLVAYVNRQTNRLLDAAKKRDALASKIAEAKKYASDVTSAARQGAGLSNLGMQPEEVTAGGIKGGLASKLAQIKHFTRYIDILAKKGLNKGLLRQILDMGPEAGYAYASALVGADKNTFKSINSLQGQLDKSTTTLGQVGADRLYDAGKNAGKGFLKGLEGQQKDIEKLMLKIATGMQKAIKKSLGIKSPSTVMAKLGAFSTQGLARGLVDGVPVLDRALDVVTGRVAGAQPVLGRAAAGGAGGVVYNVNVVVKEAMDPIAVGREFQRVLVQLGRAQGATVKLNRGGASA